MADPIEEILRELDQPVQPRPEFGTRLRDQLLDSLVATPTAEAPSRRRLPLLRELVAAAALLVFVTGLAVAFSVLHSGRAPATSPSPPPLRPSSALTQPLDVDPATPVILFTDKEGGPYQVDGMTWDGRTGKLTVIPGGQATTPNPAGTLFVAFPNILDRSGRVVASLDSGPHPAPGAGPSFVGTWADDELHYCLMVPIFAGFSPVTGTLQLRTPGGPPRDVAQVGKQSPGANTLTVSVCSVLADRAVVIQADPPGPQGSPLNRYWVVQLSTGHVLWTHDLSGSGIVFVVASRDGRYVAEVHPTGTTTIYDRNGSPVGRVNGSVKAFSWDGSLAIVDGNGGPAWVVKWRDGTVIWTVPRGEGLYGFQAEPGGTSLAIMTRDTVHPHHEFEIVPGVLYVVSSDGRVLGRQEVRSGLLLVCSQRACV
jgi:hypothetical protein